MTNDMRGSGNFSRGDPTQTLFFFFIKGKRIQIALKAGHHRPASETPLNGVALVGR